MTDQYLVYGFSFAVIYAVMMTIEVWSLRASLRTARSQQAMDADIYCGVCREELVLTCPKCNRR